uniref:Uncharacterized protein n=1 Tax=Timema shepardi TaxID=629360 RepID=A0A7R9AUW5_TIMSH|nr:unnamed protein product [Timema shepardi]
MSLVAKFTGGKRVNHGGRGSYHCRCMGAGLSHSSGPARHSSPWKRKTGHSPGSHFKEFKKREKRQASSALSFASEPQNKKRKIRADPNLDYGPLAADLEINETDLITSKEKILQSLKDDVSPPEKINIIERSTVGQHENIKWREIRRNCLNASHFGSVIKRKDAAPFDEIAGDAFDMFGLSALSSEFIEIVGAPLLGEESAEDAAWLLSVWDENGVYAAPVETEDLNASDSKAVMASTPSGRPFYRRTPPGHGLLKGDMPLES